MNVSGIKARIILEYDGVDTVIVDLENVTVDCENELRKVPRIAGRLDLDIEPTGFMTLNIRGRRSGTILNSSEQLLP
jgi:hypothetical protein